MSDTKKVVDLEFKSGGNAIAQIRELHQATKDLIAARTAYNNLASQPIQQHLGGVAAGRPLPFTTAAQNIGQGASSSISPFEKVAVQQLQQINQTLRKTYAYQRLPFAQDVEEGREKREGKKGQEDQTNNALRLAAAFAFAVTAVHAFGNALKISGNESLTAGQRAKSMIESFPVGGQILGAGRGLAEGASEISELQRRMNVELREHQAFTTARTAANIEENALRFHRDEVTNRAAALQKMPAFEQGPTARSTLAEKIAYREAQQLLPLKEEQKRTAAELAAAERTFAQRQAATRESAKTVAAFEKAYQRDPVTGLVGHASTFVPGSGQNLPVNAVGAGVVRFGRGVRDYFTKAGDELAEGQKAAQQSKALISLLSARHELEQRIKEEQQAGDAAAQTRNQLAQNGVKIAQEELSILRQREQLTTSSAQRLGAMNPFQRERAFQSLDIFKRLGERTPEAARRQAEEIAPDFVRAQYERFGAAYTQRLNQAAPGQAPGQLEANRAAVDAKQKEVAQLSRIADQKFAEDISQRFADIFNRILANLEKRLTNEIAARIAGQRFGSANAAAPN